VLADDGAKWIRIPPSNANQTNEDAGLIQEVFEVVASKASAATTADLGKSAIVSLTPGRAKYFTGEYYRCSAGKKPYLVRAVYGFGGSGAYRVRRVGQSLVVTHESIGEEATYSKSALIVNLDFEPKEVYVVASIVK
jgi:hypothetical protein